MERNSEAQRRNFGFEEAWLAVSSDFAWNGIATYYIGPVENRSEAWLEALEAWLVVKGLRLILDGCGGRHPDGLGQ